MEKDKVALWVSLNLNLTGSSRACLSSSLLLSLLSVINQPPPPPTTQIRCLALTNYGEELCGADITCVRCGLLDARWALTAHTIVLDDGSVV